MEFTGKLESVTQDYKTKKMMVTFAVDQINGIEDIRDKQLTIDARIYRRKRSLDSNAYAWVLLQKMAEKIHSNKDDCYLYCLQRYSKVFTHIIVKEDAIPMTKQMWKTVIDLGEITVNGVKGHELQVYMGSSTFDSEEMSVFLNGIVSECKELGIETMTPEEIERMNSLWGK